MAPGRYVTSSTVTSVSPAPGTAPRKSSELVTPTFCASGFGSSPRTWVIEVRAAEITATTVRSMRICEYCHSFRCISSWEPAPGDFTWRSALTAACAPRPRGLQRRSRRGGPGHFRREGAGARLSDQLAENRLVLAACADHHVAAVLGDRKRRIEVLALAGGALHEGATVFESHCAQGYRASCGVGQ